MSLAKPQFYEYKREFRWTVTVLLILIVLRLLFSYNTYLEFTSKPFYFTHADVLNSYEKSKNGKRYTVIKLHSDEGYTFYTTSHKKENFRHKRLRLQIFPTEAIKFWEFMGTFYVKSRIKKIEEMPVGVRTWLRNTIASQHENAALSTFYNAIFFATPIDKALREKIALLGVSHLVALSGFHLGILWALLYGALLVLYRPLQQKRFPYRHALLDVGIVTMLLLGLYLWFVDFPPSLVRSYAMLVLGWWLVLMGVELLSFRLLVTIILALIVLMPSLLFSLGFWLSVSGVFYIFLLLQYTKEMNKWQISILVIPVGIFLLMLPVVHMIFTATSPWQLSSPLLSLLFVPFYPLVMFLHLIGEGGLLDSMVLGLFALPQGSEEKLLPLWLGLPYIGLSISAIFYQKAFYLLLGTALLYAGYLFL